MKHASSKERMVSPTRFVEINEGDRVVCEIGQALSAHGKHFAYEWFLVNALVVPTFTAAVVDSNKDRYLAASGHDSVESIIIVLEKQESPFIAGLENPCSYG